MKPVIVFDGSCTVCNLEMAHYQRRDGAENLRWVDASTGLVELAYLGLPRHRALAALHVRDPDGRWLVGADAFVCLWSQLPAYRWLAALVHGLRLLPPMRFGYALLQRWHNGGNVPPGLPDRR